MELTTLSANYSRLAARINGNVGDQARTVARLSSGKRIASAGDDVAGLSVATRMLTRTTALRSVMTNLSQASSALQVMEGAMSEVQLQLERMNALSVMANSGALSNQERAFLDIEFQQLRDEIDRVAQETNFNGVDLLNGNAVNMGDGLFETSEIVIEGDENSQRLEGGDAGEIFFAGAGDDVVIAGGGDDVIDSGTGSDRIDAGDGNDRITLDISSTVQQSGDIPVAADLAIHIDASDTASISGHPGNVVNIQDLGTFNSDAFSDIGNVVSGTDEIKGQNALTFDGSSSLRFNDSTNLNLGSVNGRTIMVAFQTGADVSSRQVLYEQGGTVNGYNIYIDNGQLYVGAWKGNGGNFNYHLSTNIEANTSYSAGLVFDFPNGIFSGVLNGEGFGTAAVNQAQAAHSGDIGLGGVNQDTRFFDGTFSGDGARFTGKIGEFVNYRDALTSGETQAVQNYLTSKWATGSLDDVVIGGNGIDTLSFANDGVSVRIDGQTLQGVETIVLDSDSSAQDVAVTNDYFAAGTGVQADALLIDATLASEGVNFSGAELSGTNHVVVKESTGDDVFTGNNNGNVTVSYEDSGSVDVNLLLGTATAGGVDTLTDINSVIGSAFGDQIFGSAASDTLDGGAGDDVISDLSTAPTALVTRGIVHYSSFSETADLTGFPGDITGAQDQSLANNDVIDDFGTTISDETTQIAGGAAVSFGTNANLSIANSAQINTTGQTQRSIFVTMKTGDDIGTRQMVYEEGGSGNGYSIYVEGGREYVNMWRGGTGGLYLQQSVAIDPNETYNLGFVFDSSEEQDFTGYLNGIAFGSESNNQAQLAHAGRIGIGGVADNTLFSDGSSDSASFEGVLGELLIYDAALTDDELANLNDYLAVRRFNDYGGSDVINGGDGNDIITGGGGNDTIDGGNGDNDRAVFTGRFSDYQIQQEADGSYRVTDKRADRHDGSDVITNVEKLVFTDETVDISSLEQAGRLIYRAGDEGGDYIRVALPNLRSENLFRGEAISLSSIDHAKEAFDVLADAMDYLTSERARIGARLASVDILIDNTSNQLLAQDSARAVVADTDYAAVSTDYANQLVQGQMSITIAAQANQLRSDVVLDILNNATGVALTTNSPI